LKNQPESTFILRKYANLGFADIGCDSTPKVRGKVFFEGFDFLLIFVGVGFSTNLEFGLQASLARARRVVV